MAGIVAVREVLLTNVEVSAEPFQFTVDAAMKFEPVSVMVVAADPAVLEAGLRLLRAGTGFFATGEEVDPEPPHPRINKRRLMDKNRDRVDRNDTIWIWEPAVWNV